MMEIVSSDLKGGDMQLKNDQRGFTGLEAIAVIYIIYILVGLGVLGVAGLIAGGVALHEHLTRCDAATITDPEVKEACKEIHLQSELDALQAQIETDEGLTVTVWDRWKVDDVPGLMAALDIIETPEEKKAAIDPEVYAACLAREGRNDRRIDTCVEDFTDEVVIES